MLLNGYGRDSEGVAKIDVVIRNPHEVCCSRHVLAFRNENQSFRLVDERIENCKSYPQFESPYFYYLYRNGHPVINTKKEGKEKDEQRQLKPETVNADQSILAQRREPDIYPEISYLADIYDRVRIYRNWHFGRKAVIREPQKADMRTDRLEEDFSNLGLFLNHLRRFPKAKKMVLEALSDLYEGLDDFDVTRTRYALARWTFLLCLCLSATALSNSRTAAAISTAADSLQLG